MRSLRAQLTVRLLASGALLLGAAGAALDWQIRQGLVSEFDETLRATAQSLASATEEGEDSLKMDFSGEQMPNFEQPGGSEVFVLTDGNGKEIERSKSLGAARLPIRGGLLKAPAVFDATLSDGRALRCLGLHFRPQAEEEEDRGRKKAPMQPTPFRLATIVVGRDLAPLDRRLAVLRTNLLMVGLGTLAALVLIVRWGVRGAMSPVLRFSECVGALDAGLLATRFPADELPMELHPIAVRLNEMLARLESAFARERRFTATAAHELRTPLAELRSVAEVSLLTPASEAERIQSWHDILSATLRMESLSLRLLELARAEDLEGAILCESLSLREAVAAAWNPVAALATERGLTFACTIPEGLVADTDPVLLGVILNNLCGNSARHAPPDTVVAVMGTQESDGVALCIRNCAGDLSESDIPHLFERFWRKDAARSDTRHHGLGLALAAEFTALLGGKIAARLDPCGALEFVLKLPVRLEPFLSKSNFKL